MIKKILSLSLAACTALTVLSSCKTNNVAGNADNVSSTASQLDITLDGPKTSVSSEMTISNTSTVSNTDKITNPDSNNFNPNGDKKGNQNGNKNGFINSTSDGKVPPSMKLIRIWWDNNDQSMINAVNKYTALHKDVLIQIVNPPNYTVDGFKQAVNAGGEPSIVSLDHVYITSLGKSGQLVDLNAYGAKQIASLYLSSCWNGVSFGGKTYGLPHNGNTIALMYNKTMLDASKQSAPKTYSQLLSVGNAVKKYISNNKDKGDYAFTTPLSGADAINRSGWCVFNYFLWLWRNGGDILNSSNTKAIFNSAAGVNAVEQIKKLQDEGICSDKGFFEQQFYNGTIGMIEMGNWAIPSLVNAAKNNIDFKVTTLPTLKNGVTNWSGLGLFAIGVTTKAQNKQVAFDFIKFYTTTDEYQLMYGQQHNQLPVTKSALKNSYYTSSYWKLFINQFEKSKSRPGVESWDKIEKEIATGLYNAFSGTKSTQSALNDAAARVDAILK